MDNARIHQIQDEIESLKADMDDIITSIQDLENEAEQLCEGCGETVCICN